MFVDGALRLFDGTSEVLAAQLSSLTRAPGTTMASRRARPIPLRLEGLVDRVRDGLQYTRGSLMAAIEPVVRQDEEWSLRVDFSAVPLTTDQFYRLCIDNPELRLELTAEGELILMSPTGAKTGHRSSELIYQLVGWAKKDGKGLTFDSSPVFALPDGAKRSPDASWVSKERWEAISEEEQEKIAPICPDFVVELRSPSDRLDALQAKMAEYIENGARLGWLLDPLEKRVHLYRPDQQVETLDNPRTLTGHDQLEGLAVDLDGIL